MRRGAWGFGLLLAVALLVPAAAAQSPGYSRCAKGLPDCNPRAANGDQVKTGDEPVRTILFGHIGSLANGGFLTTEPPFRVVRQGPELPIVRVEGPSGPVGERAQLVLRSNAAGIHGRGHGSPQPVLPLEFELLDGTLTAYWYMRAAGRRAGPAPEHPAVMPLAGVYARLETGSKPWAGKLLAEGDVGIGYGSPSPTRAQQAVTMVAAGTDGAAYEFRVPLALKQSAVPTEGWVLTFVPYQIQAGHRVEITQSQWQVVYAVERPIRLALDTRGPLRTVAANWETVEGSTLFHWDFNSLWGDYDVDVGNLTAAVRGPGDAPPRALELIDLRLPPLPAHGSHETPKEHPAFLSPIRATWCCLEGASRLPDGEYELRASVLNKQGTYRLENTTVFHIVGGALSAPGAAPPPRAADALPLVALLTALVLLLPLARRLRGA